MNSLLMEVWGEDRLLDEEGQGTESLTGEESAEESENTAESLENSSLTDETSAAGEVQQQEASEDFLSSGTTEEETEHTAETATEVSDTDWWKIWENDSFPMMCAAAGGLLAVLLTVLGVSVFLRAKRRKKEMVQREQSRIPRRMEEPKTEQPPKSGSLGKVHNIGSRTDQQDSFGVTPFAGGQFIVVADGMGGLSGGDKISQRIVMTMLRDVAELGERPYGQVLFEMVSHANQEVNRMIGASDRYVSGSTVVAAIVEKDCFHWVSVGDSRIYLYRNKRLIQLNREHTYEAELLVQAVNGEVSFEEAQSHPKRNGLTSFIGMGELKYVDGSRRGIRLQEGDRLLLMSDGVFHTLSEEEMQQIMETSGCAEHVAEVMQDRILSYRKAKQDNFTAVIVDLQGEI